MAQDAFGLGHAALIRLLSRIAAPTAEAVHVVVNAHIRARGSAASPEL